MSVLFVNPAAGLGGSERSLLDAMASLRRADPTFRIRLLLFEPGDLEHVAREHGVDVEVEALPPSLAALGESSAAGLHPLRLLQSGVDVARFAGRLRRRVRAIAPSLVHTNGMKAHALAAAALRDYPLVVHVRDFLSGRRFSRTCLQALPRRSLVLANSCAVAADVRRAIPARPVRVVYNGIDLELFTPGPGDVSELARLSGLTPPAAGALAIGMVATYAHWKGHHVFLEAAQRLAQESTARDHRFFVVGGPIYRTTGSQLTEAELRARVRELGLEGKVGIVPFRENVADVYRGLDVVVHASTRPEPFGRTVVEAMACARPVIVSRAGGAAELFEEGRTALGFEPGDASGLARAMLRLVQDGELRAELGRAARLHAEQAFDRNRLAGELLAAYEELLGGAP